MVRHRLSPSAAVALLLAVTLSGAALSTGVAGAAPGAGQSGAGAAATTPASNPYQRGPDPTVAGVAATTGPFATASTNVSPGNGFNGGTIYYPTDASQTYGGLAIVPGYSAKFANEEAWMGPRLASFGFVVIGIETNQTTDGAQARADELLAALDWLTRSSPVRTRVDPQRLAVMGHSAGGAGTLLAAMARPSLKAAIGLAPGSPTGLSSLSSLKVPTLFEGGQNDPTVTPSYLDNLYATMPASTPSAYVQLAGFDHLSFTRANAAEIRYQIPWLKIFLDVDTRYTPFLCPSLKDPSGASRYSAKCSLIPSIPTPPVTTPPVTTPPVTTPPVTTPPVTTPPVTTPPVTTPPVTTPPVTTPPAAGCTATYATVGSWPGGFQGGVTVTAGSSALSGWKVTMTLPSGVSIQSLWNGALSTGSGTATVTNAPYNGAVPAGTSTSYGFVAGGTSVPIAVSCAAA